MLVFDSLGYTKRLESSGIGRKEAEAHAEAVKTFLIAELVTRTDLEAALDRQTLRLTIRFGGMLAAAVAIVGVISQL